LTSLTAWPRSHQRAAVPPALISASSGWAPITRMRNRWSDTAISPDLASERNPVTARRDWGHLYPAADLGAMIAALLTGYERLRAGHHRVVRPTETNGPTLYDRF